MNVGAIYNLDQVIKATRSQDMTITMIDHIPSYSIFV